MELTVQNVYGLLLRSKLLAVEEAKALFARWQEEAKDQASNVSRFIAWMVARGYVTEYQAGLLSRGHAEGFFLNEYKILDRLGKGRMAGVYKARHRLGQLVAIKVLPPSRAKEPTMLARFQREAKLAIRLRHPNIVRGFQTGKAGELIYLVMEHLEGETLEDILVERKRVSPSEAVHVVHQALLGLQHIHEQGLVHRDLKPSNLMLVPPPGKGSLLTCGVKILDIGLGRALFEEANPGEPGLTGEGVLLGTPDYMAPEQARDPRLTDIRADVYSLGCVLYHLLTGRPPFPDTNIISQMIRHATETAKPLAELNPDVPDGLQHIVSWMIAKDPAGRYPTPARAASALEMFLAAGTPTATSPDFDPSMKSYLTWLDLDREMNPPPGSDPAMPVMAMPPPPAGKPTSAAAIPAAAADKPRPKPPDRTAKTERPASGEMPAASAPTKGDKDRTDADRRKKKRAEAGAAPAPVPPPPPPRHVKPSTGELPAYADVETVEVELVGEPGDALDLSFENGFSRRDYLMFFAGVGGGLLAYFLGVGLAALIRGRPKPDPEPEDPAP